MTNFSKRDGYHLYHVANGGRFSNFSRDQVLNGNFVISHLFRNLVFGENSLESGVRGGCSSAGPNLQNMTPLTFIHIPRTGGTTIEGCTMDAPDALKWGCQNSELQGLYRHLTDLTGKP